MSKAEQLAAMIGRAARLWGVSAANVYRARGYRDEKNRPRQAASAVMLVLYRRGWTKAEIRKAFGVGWDQVRDNLYFAGAWETEWAEMLEDIDELLK